MTKVEVVVTGDDLPALREVFAAAGATGYTSVANVSGVGHHGFHQGRLAFNERDALTLVITVVPDDRAEAVLAGVQLLLADRPGVMFVSDTSVSRPEYFR
ncbi:MAG: transcriptional regulator [Actinomycetota bacterium]|nr:transcriptional regulator [Actinomycetota bacterium]